jgi:hypothetical protein
MGLFCADYESGVLCCITACSFACFVYHRLPSDWG